jgi:hypothetical protein
LETTVATLSKKIDDINFYSGCNVVLRGLYGDSYAPLSYAGSYLQEQSEIEIASLREKLVDLEKSLENTMFLISIEEIFQKKFIKKWGELENEL